MRKLFLFLTLFLSGGAWANDIIFASPSYVTVTGTSTAFLPQNGLRSYLLIVNTGSGVIYATFGAPGSGGLGVPIPVNGNYEPNKAPANSIYLVSPSGSFATIVQGQ